MRPRRQWCGTSHEVEHGDNEHVKHTTSEHITRSDVGEVEDRY
jgi:hypothetical protein